MPLRADDLPKHLRDQLEDKAGPAQKRPRDTTAGAGGPAYTCQCGERFDRWGATLERHADEAGHSRFAMDLHGQST